MEGFHKVVITEYRRKYINKEREYDVKIANLDEFFNRKNRRGT
jgi:hypothetical protein